MKRVILSGYYGFNNAGDEAILAALIDGLQKEVDDIEIIVLSANPEWTEKEYHVSAINRTDIKNLIYYFKRIDLLISGGGSLLQDVTSNKTIPYYLGIITLAKLFKVPTFFCAQGVGPISSFINQQLVKKVLNQVDKITVRDQDSKNLLKNLGVNKPVYLTADLVFGLEPINENRIEEILSEEEVKLNKPTIGISLRPWQGNEYLKELALTLDQIKSRVNANLILIPLHYPSDLEVSRQIKEEMTENIEIITGDYNPQELLGVIGEVDLLLGVRLHSLIFAAINRVPMVGISYDPKIDSFLNRLDLFPLEKINNLQHRKLSDKIIEFWRKKDKIKVRIDKKIRNLEGLCYQNLEVALRLLGDLDEK